MVMRAARTGLFRTRFNRDPATTARDYGFRLSEAGMQALQDLEIDDWVGDSPTASRYYH